MTKLSAIPPERKTGQERFRSGQQDLDFSILDFWQWAGSDLLNNRERGIVAEFLVARALGVDDKLRVEWDAKDLVTKSGVPVEVKSAAYVQSWAHDELSYISFDIAPRKGWDADSNSYATRIGRAADVYVFCLLAEQDQTRVDPLDVAQWKFWVVSSQRLTEQLGDQESAALSTIERVAGLPVALDELASAIEELL